MPRRRSSPAICRSGKAAEMNRPGMAERAGFRDVLGVPDFRVLLFAQSQTAPARQAPTSLAR